MQQVPTWWIWFSGLYFVFSSLWTIGLCVAVWALYRKVMPILTEAQMQVHRIGDQARGVAARASNTAELVQKQTTQLLGTAETVSERVTQQARTVGVAVTVLLVAGRALKFVRKIV